mgnify:CR=1 FL=1|tara:strand:- start:235 stop:453 length:219 start_codon:yes stop_codon:yes gene_type:complete
MKKLHTFGNLLSACCSLVLFLFLSLSSTATAQEKVVGGVDVDIRNYPWQVGLTSSPTELGFVVGQLLLIHGC